MRRRFTYEETGEFRFARKGEWFLNEENGGYPEQASCHAPYAMLVRIITVPIIELISDPDPQHKMGFDEWW